MIQARVGSKRFKNKVLALIEDKPLLWHVINRIKNVKEASQLILITSTKNDDKVLLELANKSNISSFAGDQKDVLDRYYQCAIKFDADPIIRITADCPLIDPWVISKLLNEFTNGNYDYGSNCLPYTLPDGLDVEVFSFKTLKKMKKNAKSKLEKEHVTLYLRNHLKEFKIFNYENSKDYSGFRWTVDYEKDLEVVRRIYNLLKPELVFSFEEIFSKIAENNLKLNDFGLIKK